MEQILYIIFILSLFPFALKLGFGATNIFYLSDGKSNVGILQKGQVVDHKTTSYQAYGKIEHLSNMSQLATANENLHLNYGYNHEYQDKNNALIYLRARFIVPDRAHFLSRDSYLKTKSGVMWNRYAYTSNPVMKQDYSGHSSGLVKFLVNIVSAVTTNAIVGGILSLITLPEGGWGYAISIALNAAAGVAGSAIGSALTHSKVSALDMTISAGMGALIGGSVAYKQLAKRAGSMMEEGIIDRQASRLSSINMMEKDIIGQASEKPLVAKNNIRYFKINEDIEVYSLTEDDYRMSFDESKESFDESKESYDYQLMNENRVYEVNITEISEENFNKIETLRQEKVMAQLEFELEETKRMNNELEEMLKEPY